MYGCESWTIKKAETLESLLDCKDIKPVHLKGNQSWMFIGRTDAEAKTPILWPLDAKNWLIWKDPYAGKDSGRRRRRHRMWWWHHQLNGQNLSKFGSLWTGKPGVLHAVHGVTKSWTWLSDWTDWRSFTSFIRFIIKYFSRHSSSFWLQRRCCQGFIIK